MGGRRIRSRRGNRWPEEGFDYSRSCPVGRTRDEGMCPVVEDVHSRGADRVPARRRTLLVAQSGLVNETTEINRTARRSYRPPWTRRNFRGGWMLQPLSRRCSPWV